MWEKKGKGQREMTFRGLPGTKSILMKGNWTFETGHGGRVEKHEKEKQGAYLGNFYLVAQLSTRNSKPGELGNILMTLNAKVRDQNIIAWGC